MTAIDTMLNKESHEHYLSKSYVIVRPPGHHAHQDLITGFCYFNNVAFAAMRCVEKGKKVLIVDWDIH